MYHSVARESSSAFLPWTVPPQLLTEHLAAIDHAGYRAVTVSEYVEQGAREGTVVLSFDDGFRDFHQHVLPRLSERGWPATAYVPTAYVGATSRWLSAEGEGRRAVMDWSALAEVVSAGIEVGSHSRTHCQLDLIRSPNWLLAEVRDSRGELEDKLQCRIRSFAYPFGYRNRRVRAAVVHAGYDSACAVRDLPDHQSDPYAICRFTVRHDTTARQVLDVLSRRPTLRSLARSEGRDVASHLLRRASSRRFDVGRAQT
jgi:peptidoglycan/xylan/chitin deacetylase (PgdA/CDA1 family)